MKTGAVLPWPRREDLARWHHELMHGGWWGPVVISGTFLFMLFLSWRKSGDLLVDFGRELYVPWRIAQGETLYLDIAYFNGPLSPYFNSLWFKLFGASLTTLLIVNLIILLGQTIMLYRLLSGIADRHSAIIACVVFVTLFGFEHMDFGYLDKAGGNYNYLTPYSHEMTHGMALSLLAFFLLARAPRWRSPLVAVAGSGSCLGLVFLTKPEIFLALGLAMPIALGSFVVNKEMSGRYSFSRVVGVFALAALLPPLTAFILLSLTMPTEVAVRGLLGAWYWIFNREVLSFPFYSKWMGIDDPGDSVRQLAVWTARYLAALAPAMLLSFVFRQRHQLLGAVLGMVPIILLVYWYVEAPMDMARPLPLVMAVLTAACLIMAWRYRVDTSLLSRMLFLLAFVVFAGALLAKMLLYSRILFYGFVLAMPATMLTVLALIRWIPDWIDRAKGHGRIFRLAGLGTVSIVLLIFGGVSYIAYDQLRIVAVAQGKNQIFSDKVRAPHVNAALQALAQRGDEGTLCVFPRGMMINFLAQRPCPTPYFDFHPFELFLYGEDRVLQSLQDRPPDYVMVVHLPMYAEELPFFGRHYAHRLDAWIKTHYSPTQLFGAPPFQGSGFGLLLMQRTAAKTSILSVPNVATALPAKALNLD